MEIVVGLGIVVALGATLRSTWSPCGQSMLSQITPLSERGRNQHFSVTAGWFVVGSVLGGATLGALAAFGAALTSAADLSSDTALAILAVLALVAAAIDTGVFGFRPPFFRRQVNEDWLPRYRGWLYGVGFGWQVGVGIATYIMTAAVFLVVAIGVLTASPAAAFAIAVLFGFARAHGLLHRQGAHSRAALVIPPSVRRVGRAGSPRGDRARGRCRVVGGRCRMGCGRAVRAACADRDRDVVVLLAPRRARAQESTARAHA